jgi:biopolymer transport protein ExbB/TolQ
MNWLKNAGNAVWFGLAAVLAAFAAMQATSRKRQAEEWQRRAEDEAAKDIEADVNKANALLSQAKMHNAEARRIARKAEERIDALAKRDDTVSDIVSKWVRDDQ